VLPQLARLAEITVNFFFPRWCVGCGKSGYLICDSCRQSLNPINPPLCPRCGKPQSSADLCSGCATWQAEIDGIRSAFQFEGVLREAIHQLKYKNIKILATPLARLLSDYLSANPLPADVLVPVPLHPRRLKERGYNQSRLLARELGKLVNLPLVSDCLVRNRHAPPQARTLTLDERRANVIGAFTCRDQRLKGKQVLLIDDVSTSGATLNACAAALKASGATSVWGLTIAKEI
jgi:competence protein ComFC